MSGLASTLSYASPNDPFWKSALIRSVEWLTGRRRLERLYRNTPDEPDTTFWEAALDQLDVTLEVDRTPLGRIPDRGPVVFVTNHPFGVLDGLAVCHLVASVRPSFQILINSVLCRDARLEAHFLPVSFEETREARRTNLQTIRTAMTQLDDGGAVAIFPAGGIATAPRGFGDAEDLEWKPFAAKLIRTAQATVVPLYVHGQNSRLFHLASQVSLSLRLSLIIREVLRRTGDTLPVTIGEPIPYDALAAVDSRDALTAHLRRETFALAP